MNKAHNDSLIFSTQCYASVVYAAIMCLFVCSSICHTLILSKQLNLGSHKEGHTIAKVLWFSEAKDLSEI